MSTCSVHGYYDGCDHNPCPRCVEAEAYDATVSLEILKQLAQARIDAEKHADEIKNPGDYLCPHCGNRTLKKGYPRCCRCHGVVGAHFWAEIEAKERASEAELSKLRIQKARILATVPECQLLEIPDQPTDTSTNIAVYSTLLFFWLLPFLIAKFFLLNHAQQGDSPPPAFVLLIPGLNWIGLLFSFPWLSGGFGVAVNTIGGAIGVSMVMTWLAQWRFKILERERQEIIKTNDKRKLDRQIEIEKLLLKEAEQNATHKRPLELL